MPADLESSYIPIAEHDFGCSRCDESAGVVQLFGSRVHAELVRISFTSRLTKLIDADEFDDLHLSIIIGDIEALYAHDLEVASFYCPQCKACFCGSHWNHWEVFDDGFHDCIRGVCPQGHERMLED